jgi:hypothetical protein
MFELSEEAKGALDMSKLVWVEQHEAPAKEEKKGDEGEDDGDVEVLVENFFGIMARYLLRLF